MYYVVKYTVNGVDLYAVERIDGWIDRYCDNKKDAQEYCDKKNGPASSTIQED